MFPWRSPKVSCLHALSGLLVFSCLRAFSIPGVLFSLQLGSQKCWGLHSPKVILNSEEQELMYKYPSFCSPGGDNLRGVPHGPSEGPNGMEPQFPTAVMWPRVYTFLLFSLRPLLHIASWESPSKQNASSQMLHGLLLGDLS